MTRDEIKAIFAIINDSSQKIRDQLVALVYAMENATDITDIPVLPITEEQFSQMWTEALGRMPEGKATITQAQHLLYAIETHYGIKR